MWPKVTIRASEADRQNMDAPVSAFVMANTAMGRKSAESEFHGTADL